MLKHKITCLSKKNKKLQQFISLLLKPAASFPFLPVQYNIKTKLKSRIFKNIYISCIQIYTISQDEKENHHLILHH